MTPREFAEKLAAHCEIHEKFACVDCIEEFYIKAIAEEREACAKLAETCPVSTRQVDWSHAKTIAAAIRARTS